MKKLYPIIIFILILVGMDLFTYIPIVLFHIDINSFSIKLRVIYTLCTDIGFMIIIYTLYKKILDKSFKDYVHNFSNNFTLSIKYYFIGLFIMLISNNIIALFFTNASANNEHMVRLLIDKYPWYMLFSVAIYAPFIEEILFRKCIKDIIIEFGNNKTFQYIYIIISGLLFGLMHVIGTANNISDYLYIIPYMSLGCTFAYTYNKTDNIFNTIIIHSMHNMVAIILYFMIGG